MLFLLFLLAAVVTGAQADCKSCLAQKKTWCESVKSCGFTPCPQPISKQINCPIVISPENAYDDTFTRNKIFPLCSAANSNNPETCVKNWWPSMSVYNKIHIFNCTGGSLPQTNCFVYTSVDTSAKTLLISFRGTDTAIQLLEEFNSYFRAHRPFFDSGNVFMYFYEAFMKLWDSGLSADMRKLKYLYPDYTLYVTGHSLGGALASLAASYFVKIGLYKPEMIKLVTFGQPRLGDLAFAEWHDDTFAYSYRVVHHKDIVAHIPFQDDVINHDTFYHHHTEIWYNNDMSTPNYHVCKEADGLYCSNLQIDSSVQDHLTYFTRTIHEWVPTGCPH